MQDQGAAQTCRKSVGSEDVSELTAVYRDRTVSHDECRVDPSFRNAFLGKHKYDVWPAQTSLSCSTTFVYLQHG